MYNPSDIFPTYTGKLGQKSYTIQNSEYKWKKKQIKDQSILCSNWTPKQRWNWFKHTQYYAESTINKVWSQLKKDKSKRFKPSPPPPSHQPHQNKLAKEVAAVLFKYKYDNNMDIFYWEYFVYFTNEYLICFMRNIWCIL